MSIRITVLSLIVAYLCVYAWRDWFRALCGAIVLMAFLEHPDMPRHIFGIVGLNLWNILLINVLIGWAQQRHYEGLQWDTPGKIKIAFILYCFVIAWAFSRAFLDPTRFYEFNRTTLLINYFVNPLRFLIPGLLLYHGCRTRERVVWALSAIILLYFLLSVQVIRYMGIHVNMSGTDLAARAAKIIHHSVGYDRVDMSMMLSGASWAMVAFSLLFQNKRLKWSCWGVAGLTLLAQAMTGGRAGYVTWGVTGLVLGVVRWRKLLPIVPVAAAIVLICLPSVRERMLYGFGVTQSGPYVEETDTSEITSGRIEVWPYVIEKIKESPLIGYGRIAMIRTGLAQRMLDELREEFGHPHNAYLEMLLDNGIVGFVCVIPIYLMLLTRCVSLFRDRHDVLFAAAGGIGLSLVLALLVAGMGAQTLYPREGVLGMWAALGVALRVWVEREWLYSTGESGLAEGPAGLDAQSEALESEAQPSTYV
jgi:O-antigen ligase